MGIDSPTERSTGKDVAFAAVAALIAVLLVHGGAWMHPLTGLDRARIAAVTPAIGDRPGIADEEFLGRDATPLILSMERAICGGRDRAYIAIGWLWVAAAATALAFGIARTTQRRPYVLPAAAALFAAAPQWSGAGVAGHVHAIAWIFFGLLLAIRPTGRGFALKLVGAVAMTPAFAQSIGPLFLIVPFIPHRGTRYHGRTGWKVARYLAAGLAFFTAMTWVVSGPHLSLRNGVDPSITTTIDHARRVLFVTLTPIMVESTSLRTMLSQWIFAACGIGALIVGGKAIASDARSLWTIGLSAIGVVAFVLLQSPPTADHPDSVIGLGAAFLTTLVLATSLARTNVRSNRESVAFGLVFAWLALSFVAASARRAVGPGADDLAEVERIRSQLDEIKNVDAVALFCAPTRPGALAPSSWIKASTAEPFGRRQFDLDVVGEGRLSDRIGPLFASERRTMLAEWKPVVPGATDRAKAWTIAPFLGVDRGVASQKIELVAPVDRAYGKTARPTTIDDDMTFVFAVEPGVLLDEDAAVVFYSYWDGGSKPRGRQELTSRILAPGVLEKRPRADGKVECRWRTSVRPGEGHDGVPFDDPDLELDGKTMLWTIGIVHGHGLNDGCPDGHDHGHDHHHEEAKKEKPVSVEPEVPDSERGKLPPAHPDRRMSIDGAGAPARNDDGRKRPVDIRRPILIAPFHRLNFASTSEFSRKLH